MLAHHHILAWIENPMPPLLLVQLAVAAVWIYEGLWNKLLSGSPNQVKVVEAAPYFSPAQAIFFLRALGVVEVALGIWVVTGWQPVWCALVQTGLLVGLNANGLLFSRHLIHDPGGMVVKNFCLLILAWVAAGLAVARPS